MKLYFENRYGEKKVIAEPSTEEEALQEINKFCESNNFKVYYIRSWMIPDGLKKFDVLSTADL